MSNLRSKQADQALLKYESGQEHVAAQKMTDSGDQTKFSISDYPWSGRAGYEAQIRPNGVITGGAVTPGSSNDTVDVAALTCYLSGSETDVSASSGESVTRPTTDDHLINSVTITSGGAIAIVTGAEGTSFSDTRGADGGPPWIDNDAIEIAWVKLDSQSAAAVESDEIYQVPGESLEKYDYPIWAEYPALGEVEFVTALAVIHSEDAGGTTNAKQIYAEVYTPIFANLEPVSDFVPPETTHSVSSTQVYGGSIGSTTSSLNQGSFTAYVKDNVTDTIIDLKGEILWFKFFPHRLKNPFILCQGTLGIARTFPAGDAMQASCTISAESEGVNKAS